MSNVPLAAQTHEEAIRFVEAFARINVEVIREGLGSPFREVAWAERALEPDWDDPRLLEESGLSPAQVDDSTRSGLRFLHIDVATAEEGAASTELFLGFTGLSDKQRKLLFPA